MDEALDWLSQQPDMSEPRRLVGTYRAERTPPGGGSSFAVTITVWDAGPGAGIYRYSVEARADGGRVATGNPERTIEAALSLVHWQDLDGDHDGC